MTQRYTTYSKATGQFIEGGYIDGVFVPAAALDARERAETQATEGGGVPARNEGEPIQAYAKRLLASNVTSEIDVAVCPQPEPYEPAPVFCERLLASGYMHEGLDVKSYLSRFVRAQAAIRACSGDLGDQVARLKGLI